MNALPSHREQRAPAAMLRIHRVLDGAGMSSGRAH